MIISARYPVNSSVPHNALVKYNPFTQVLLFIHHNSESFSIVTLLIVLFIFLFTGRGFCGWVCPVGTGLDVFNRFLGRRIKRRKSYAGTNSLRIKNVVLICSVILLAFGFSLYWLFDPTSMFTRNTALVLHPVLDTSLRESARAVSGIPDIGYSIVKFIRAVFNPLPVKSVYFWLFTLLLTLMFLLEFVSRRFFCKFMCPLGALLGYFSSLSPIKINIDQNACTRCGQCLKSCRTGALSLDDNLRLDNPECVLCLTCIDTCRFNALSSRIEKPVANLGSSTVNRHRRDFVSGIIAAVVMFPVYKITGGRAKRPKHLIRPPGALPEDIFTDVCAKCGSCMKVCFTSGIQPVMFQNGLNSLFTPKMDFTNGFCGYECVDCGNVCPTGAITPLTLERKRNVVMGVAKINLETCWPWGEKKACLTCEEVCPIYQKAIELENRPVVYEDGFEDIIKLPHVIEENCIGCGICEYHCPAEPEKAIRIVYESETRGGEIRTAPARERRENFTTDEKTFW